MNNEELLRAFNLFDENGRMDMQELNRKRVSGEIEDEDFALAHTFYALYRGKYVHNHIDDSRKSFNILNDAGKRKRDAILKEQIIKIQEESNKALNNSLDLTIKKNTIKKFKYDVAAVIVSLCSAIFTISFSLYTTNTQKQRFESLEVRLYKDSVEVEKLKGQIETVLLRVNSAKKSH